MENQVAVDPNILLITLLSSLWRLIGQQLFESLGTLLSFSLTLEVSQRVRDFVQAD